jgi:site-specific DNA-methyltransferase (adenine-specific)
MLMGQKILKDVITKAYFSDKDFVLFKEDCIELLKQIPEDSIDMIFADPPYNLSNGGFTVHAGKMVSVNKGKWDESKGLQADFDFHIRWLEECYRVLKPNGTIWVSGTYHSIYQCGYALQLLGYKILNDIAWFKPNASPNLSCRYFTASHETLLWARKNPKGKHTFNYEVMKDWEDNYKKPFKSPTTGKQEYIEVIHEKGKQMRSVWAIGTPKREEKVFGKHPTQKPVALLERVVLSSTNKGDVILDPFTGSSTTGVVAVKNRRKFIGIDLEKEYLEVSKKRFEQGSKARNSL